MRLKPRDQHVLKHIILFSPNKGHMFFFSATELLYSFVICSQQYVLLFRCVRNVAVQKYRFLGDKLVTWSFRLTERKREIMGSPCHKLYLCDSVQLSAYISLGIFSFVVFPDESSDMLFFWADYTHTLCTHTLHIQGVESLCVNNLLLCKFFQDSKIQVSVDWFTIWPAMLDIKEQIENIKHFLLRARNVTYAISI
jgi:hypothetical protein